MCFIDVSLHRVILVGNLRRFIDQRKRLLLLLFKYVLQDLIPISSSRVLLGHVPKFSWPESEQISFLLGPSKALG